MGLVKTGEGATIVSRSHPVFPSPTAQKSITGHIREDKVILCEVLGSGQADESVYHLTRNSPVSTCGQRSTVWLSILGDGEVFASKPSPTQEAPP